MLKESGENMEAKRAVVGEREAAQYIGMSRSFLAQARCEGNRKGRTPGPPYIRLGRSCRYLVEDLKEWLQENRHVPHEAEGA